MAAPNVLLVVTDQQRPDLFGAAGRLPVRTPAIDRLCAEGLHLTRAYASCPVCTPSRASIISGQYPSRHGAWTAGVITPEDVLSLPRLLADRAGYRTGIIGKSHFQPCVSIDADTYTWEFTRPDPRDTGLEAPPRSWDLDFFRSWHGPWYGFDHASISVGHTYDPHAYSMHYAVWLDDRGIRREPPYFMARREAELLLGDHGIPGLPNRTAGSGAHGSTWALPAELHSSAWVADETIDYLQGHVRGDAGAPFFLSVNFPDPHYPLLAPEPWDRMYDGVEVPQPARRLGEWEGKPSLYQATIEGRVPDGGWSPHGFPLLDQRAIVTPTEGLTEQEERWWRSYMGMQSLLDHHLGRILDELDTLGLAGETLVVVTSDHGDYMGDHFLWSKGGSHYDGAARVPLVVRWPGRIPAGERSPSLQSLADLAPTILRAAGLEPHPEMQGVDQLPSWTGGTAVRDGVLIEHRLEAGLHVDTFLTDRHRLSIHSDTAHRRTEYELYDLQEDPQEFDSLAADEGQRALFGELVGEAWRASLELKAPWPERIARA